MNKLTVTLLLYRKIQVDVHKAAAHIQEPAQLKEAMRQLYQKYAAAGVPGVCIEEDVQLEYTRCLLSPI